MYVQEDIHDLQVTNFQDTLQNKLGLWPRNTHFDKLLWLIGTVRLLHASAGQVDGAGGGQFSQGYVVGPLVMAASQLHVEDAKASCSEPHPPFAHSNTQTSISARRSAKPYSPV